MTAPIANSTCEICPICSVDFTDSEKNETKKVIKLSCKHFFHMSCLASWFDNRKENFKNLNCDNCAQLSTVSDEYVERKIVSYLQERLMNISLFDVYLEQLCLDYYYDDQVLEAIPHARNLQKNLLLELLKNPLSSIEENLQLLQTLLNKMEGKDGLKEIVGSIVKSVLFDHRPLRTLQQKIKRWENIFKLATLLTLQLRVLDETNPKKIHIINNFKEEMINYSETYRKLIDADSAQKRNNAIVNCFFIGISIGLVAGGVFNYIRK